MQSMQQTTATFISNADWLTENDQPAVIALEHAAIVLDDPDKFTASMLAQYHKIYTELKNSRKEDEPDVLDEEDQFLEDIDA